MWTIYSIGDVNFLQMVINSVAAIAGTGNIEQVFGIGLLIGVFVMGFQSILQGGQSIKFQNAFVAFILFSLMFGSTTRVAIEDMYRGESVVTVDNVPLGIAAAGSILSSMGAGLTKLMEQAYAHPGSVANGFGTALGTMADIRKEMMTKSSLGSANSPSDGDDIWQSWTNYIADCTMVGVDSEQYTVNKIGNGERDGSLLDQLKFNSTLYGTKLELANFSGYATCSDAFGRLKNYTENTFVPALYVKMGKKWDMSESEARQLINDSFAAINKGSQEAEQYMLTSAMTPIFNWGLVQNEVNFQRTTSAAALHAAIQKRNETWAAEQALFDTVSRPMMTFFEGLMFAIAPLMAFLIGLGPAGFSLLGKYLLMALWVQLWMPVMSIINLYIHMSAKGKMAYLGTGSSFTDRLDSFYGIEAADQAVQAAIATGGLLAASVPGITLMLVYGTSIAATSLAGRMSSSGEYDASLGSPALASKFPTLDIGPQMQARTGSGITATDAVQSTLSLGTNYTSGASSSYGEMQQQQKSFMNTLGQTTGISHSNATTAAQNVQKAVGSVSQESEAFKAMESHGRNLLEGTKFSDGLSSEAYAQIGLASTAGANMPSVLSSVLPVKASSSGSAQNGEKAGYSSSELEELSKSISDNAQKSTESGASLVSSLAKHTVDNHGWATNITTSGSNTETLQNSAQESLAAQQNFQTFDNLQRSAAMSTSYTNAQAGQRLLNMGQEPGGLNETIDQFLKDYSGTGILEDVNNNASLFMGNDPHLSKDNAVAAAKLFAIADGDFYKNIDNPEAREDAIVRGSEILSNFYTGNSQPDYGHNKFDGIGNAASGVDIQSEAGGVSGPGVDYNKFTHDTVAKTDAADATVSNVDTEKDYKTNEQSKRDWYDQRESELINKEVAASQSLFDNRVSGIEEAVSTYAAADDWTLSSAEAITQQPVEAMREKMLYGGPGMRKETDAADITGYVSSRDLTGQEQGIVQNGLSSYYQNEHDIPAPVASYVAASMLLADSEHGNHHYNEARDDVEKYLLGATGGDSEKAEHAANVLFEASAAIAQSDNDASREAMIGNVASLSRAAEDAGAKAFSNPVDTTARSAPTPVEPGTGDAITYSPDSEIPIMDSNTIEYHQNSEIPVINN